MPGEVEKGVMTTACSATSTDGSNPDRDKSLESEVPLYKKISYGSVSFATLSLGVLVNAFGSDFYVQLGAILPMISLFTALGRSFDIVTDLCMAWYSDTVQTPYGRRRPFMAVGCIPYGILFFLFFSPPGGLSSMAISIYFGVMYITFYLSDTLTQIPYEALGPELSQNPQERNTIFFIARLFQILGATSASTLPAGIQAWLAAGGWTAVNAARMAFAITSAFFGLWYIISTLICVSVIQERQQPKDEGEVKDGGPLIPAIMRSFHNPAITSLIVAWVMDGLQLAVLVTLFPFYIRYYIRPNGPEATAIGVRFLPTVFVGMNITLLFSFTALSTPVWLALAQRFGKFRSWIAYNVLGIFTNLLLLVVRPGQNVLVLVVMALNGLPGGGSFLNSSIMADVVDYEEYRHGVRSEGLFSVYATLVNKTVAIPGSAIPLGILAVLGFMYPINGVEQPQPVSVTNFLYYGISIFTAGCSIIGVMSKSQFPIRTESVVFEIQDKTQILAAGGSAVDPITGTTRRRLQLTGERLDIYWILENFHSRTRVSILKTGGVDQLIQEAWFWAIVNGMVSGLLGFVAVVSLSLLVTNTAVSVAATVAVIASSFSLCYTYVCVSSLLDARKLRQYPKGLVKEVLQEMRSSDGDEAELSAAGK